MRAVRYATLALALTSTALNARKETQPQQPPAMPAGYDNPGPKPTNLLPDIFAELRRTLTDPYSIRDFQICELHATKPIYNSYGAGEWMRSQWMVDFSLNAKNRMGGYAGRTAFIASYKDGKLESVTSSASFPDINAKQVAEIASCPRIPDAEVQKFLAN